MEFDERFRKAVDEVNSHASEPDISKALGKYDGRAIVLSVDGDGTYVFRIAYNGVDYEYNPAVLPDDMEVRMDLKRARKLVYEQKVGLSGLWGIKRKNIGLADIEFARSLFEGYTGENI